MCLRTSSGRAVRNTSPLFDGDVPLPSSFGGSAAGLPFIEEALPATIGQFPECCYDKQESPRGWRLPAESFAIVTLEPDLGTPEWSGRFRGKANGEECG